MTNYAILLPPSEGKREGGDKKYIYVKEQNSFNFLENERKFLLQKILDFISKANNLDLEKLFVVKSNIEEITALLKDFDQKLTLPAINRYSGVMFNAIDYPSLNEDQKNRADQVILFIDGLFGLLKPQDFIPNYKLAISAKFTDFKIDFYWKKIFKDYLAKILENKIILDILPQAHRKAVDINQKNCYLINFFTMKNCEAKNAGHISKKLKGEFIRYILGYDKINLEILHNFSHSEGYEYSEDLSSDNEIIFLKK